MTAFRKLILSFSLVILVITIYMFSSEHNTDMFIRGKERIMNTIKSFRVNVSDTHEKRLLEKVKKFIDPKDTESLKGYIVDEMLFGNIQAIEKVTEAELNELAKLGIKREKSDHIVFPVWQTKKKKKKKKTVKPVVKKEEDKKTVSTVIPLTSIGSKVRLKYKYRNPRAKDLMKLSKKQLEEEAATDPLPSSAVCDKKAFLTVFVVSTPKNFLRRQFIRDSWGYSYVEDIKLLKHVKTLKSHEKFPTTSMFRMVFVLGQTRDGTHMKDVYEEAKLNKDIVFGNVIEDYTNLTMKTRLGLKWAYYDCDSSYVLKTDDDVFINPIMIVEWLKDMPRKNFYTGWCNFGSIVVRDPNSKWYVSKEFWAEEKYPGYCLGGGYLMSNNVLGKVMSSSYGRQLFPMEDLYVGLLIHEMKEVTIQDEKKHFDLVYGGRDKICDMNELFLAHQVIGKNLVDHIKRAREALTSC